GLERAGRRSTPDRFETQALEFFERVRGGYRALAAAAPERYRVIDAARSFSEVSQQVAGVLDDFLDARST
ncbi:MAG: dTMP kinase, partial [Sedimenticolaceae bacterium]